MRRRTTITFLGIVGTGALAILIGARPGAAPRSAPSFNQILQGDYQVNVVNDLGADYELEVFATTDYTATRQSYGLLPSGQSAQVSLAPGGEMYVFRAHEPGAASWNVHDTNVPEAKLADMGYTVRLLADVAVEFTVWTPDVSTFPTPPPPPTP
jgi:hypothetical protein